MGTTTFVDRREAGQLLADALTDELDEELLENAVLLALPRGGVPVAAEIAQLLQLPLDILLVRKIGAPAQPEYAIGTLVEDNLYLDEQAAQQVGASGSVLDAIVEQERQRIAAYRVRYRKQPPVDLGGRNVIVVDDGVATGITALSAAHHLREHGAATLTLAVPVAAISSIERLGQVYDRIVCVEPTPKLLAVGLWYESFQPPSDEELLSVLRR